VRLQRKIAETFAAFSRHQLKKMNSKQPTASDWGIVFLLALIWGGSFLLIKKSLLVYTPVQAGMLRMGFSALAYIPLALYNFKKIDWSKWKYFLVVSVFGSGLPNLLFPLAQTKVTSSLAGILNALTPVFTMLLGAWFFKIAINRDKVLGLSLSFLGAVALILFAKGGTASLGGETLYALLCVLATICYAINSNTVSNNLRGSSPVVIGSAAFLITCPVYFVAIYFSGAYETTMAHPNPWLSLGALAWLAVVSTTFASILFFMLIQRTNAVFATSVTFLLPVMAIILGSWDGEKIGIVQLLGTALILSGLYLTRK
jgi:drug/metabolite transporter (DMT)-like permease